VTHQVVELFSQWVQYLFVVFSRCYCCSACWLWSWEWSNLPGWCGMQWIWDCTGEL